MILLSLLNDFMSESLKSYPFELILKTIKEIEANATKIKDLKSLTLKIVKCRYLFSIITKFKYETI